MYIYSNKHRSCKCETQTKLNNTVMSSEVETSPEV